MHKLLLVIVFGACSLCAQDNYNGRTFWRTSVTALGAANAMDIHSSWGKHELNSTLASSNGTFGAQGALIKLGLQGSLIGIEYLITRHRPGPRLYHALGSINFGAAAGITGVAFHNYSIPGR